MFPVVLLVLVVAVAVNSGLLRASKMASCKVKVDVGFILDTSGRVEINYQKEKDFIKKIAGAFGVSDDGSRASVITFSYNAELVIRFNDYKDIKTFNADVHQIPLIATAPRLEQALRLTRDEMFLTENGARPDTPNILILLIDGSETGWFSSPHAFSSSPHVCVRISESLRNSGIVMIVVGIGSATDPKELNHITGGTESMTGGTENTFIVSSFDQLIDREFVKQFIEMTCEVVRYQSIGCYKDKSERAISGKMTHYAPGKAIEKCYERADKEGNDYFAIQDNGQGNGQCFTSPDAGNTYTKYGKGVGCRYGRGGTWRLDVYQINKLKTT